jgi:uncharacterized protein (TIGR03086 family)
MKIHDLRPAAEPVAALADRVTDDHLGDPTPCPDWPVLVMVNHLISLTEAFTDGARKIVRDDAPEPVASLPDGWQDLLRSRLDELVEAWRDPAAWEGEATVGGVTLPAGMTAAVVTDELVVHGWDLAVALGADYRPDPAAVTAALGFAEQFADLEGGPFGPSLPVPEGAGDLDRLLRLAGRDPAWTRPA